MYKLLTGIEECRSSYYKVAIEEDEILIVTNSVISVLVTKVVRSIVSNQFQCKQFSK